jgi:hypothetical protein
VAIVKRQEGDREIEQLSHHGEEQVAQVADCGV